MALLVLAGTPPLAAQDRAGRIEQARGQFDDAAALGILFSAANPGLAPLDSLWAVSVQEIALRLTELNDPAGAAIWLRWGARHGGRWAIDRSFFPPPLVASYDLAIADALGSVEPGDAVSTEWRWPALLDRNASGTLELAPSPAAIPITATVEGQGNLSPGGSLVLRPGTYNLALSADGYEPLRVTREVLPGVGTILSASLVAAPQEAMVPQITVRRGLPIKWVGAGLAAAGAAAFLLLQGGGGGGTPTTGGIEITIPAG